MKPRAPIKSATIMVLMILAIVASETSRASDARFVSELYATVITNYYDGSDGSDWFDTYAATMELNWYPALKPWYGGIVIDYRDSSSHRLNNNLSIGVYFRYNFNRWDSTMWLFVSQSPDSSPEWVYATRLRYRVLASHKVGVEALAPLERADEPKLMFGYYGQVAETLSLNALAGRSVGRGPDFAARIELVWQSL